MNENSIRTAIKLSLLIFLVASNGICLAQSISIKPYASYATVQMNEVNSGSDARIESLRELTGVYVPNPDPFEGSYAWGIQIGYHLEDNYFLTFATYYFTEDRDLHYRDASQGYQVIFDNLRDIRFFEFSFGMKYFFRYSSWKRINHNHL